ncbi:hypothetical protein WJX82_011216 [Trebouxia sp. C0006]
MCAWADQAHPFIDKVPEPAINLQQTRVPDSALQQSAPSELQQLAASSKYCLHPFAQEHSAALQQVAALHGSSTAGDIGGLERNAAAHDGRGDFLQCDAGSVNRAGPSDIRRLGTAAETKPASSSYPGISCDNRCEPAIMVLDLDACLARTTFQETVASGVEPVLEGLLRFEAQLFDAQRSLFRLDSLGLWVKLRPGVHQLLQTLHGRFQTWAFTSATL